MNITLPDVFNLSSLSRALDEDIAAQEHAAIDYAPMDVDDEWTPPPVLLMDNAPRPWYNPGPQPAWNNLDLELEDPPVENASQDVPGWYVNLRDPNDQPRPNWRDYLPVVSVRKVENARVKARVWEAPTTPVPAPRPWYNPEPQPAWNNLELELENPPVEDAPQVQSQDVPGLYDNLRGRKEPPHSTRLYLPVVSVRRIEKAHVQNRAPTPVPAPRLWHNSKPQPVQNNRELELENLPVENTSQVQNQDVPGSYVNLRGQKDQGYYLPVVSVRRIENTRVRKTPTPPIAPVVLDRETVVPSLATKAEKAGVFGVPGSAIKVEKVHARVAPTPARRAGNARVPGISVPTRKAEIPCAPAVLASVRKTCALDVPSARKAEKSRAPTPPRAPAPSKSLSTPSKPVVALRIDFTNMSSSSKVKLEDMPKVDDPMCISWPTSTLAYSIQRGSPKPTAYHRRNSPITHAHQTRADKDVVMIENDYTDLDPAISAPTTKETTSDNTHVARLTEPLQPVADHAEDGEPTVDHNATPEDEVDASDAKEEDSASTNENGEDKSEEAEETEEERQARIARLMTEVFGDGEDSDDEESPSVKDAVVSQDHPSTPATSDALTVDATESITDWSLDTPDDAGTEGNGCVGVADGDDEDEESQFNYRAQLLADIFGDDEEDGQSVQEAPLVPLPVPVIMDPRKRKREDDGPSAMPGLATKDHRKRKREDDVPPPMPCLVTTDPRKRKREDDGSSSMPCLVTRDPRKRKREDDRPSPMPCLITTDPRKRKREDDESSPIPCLATVDPRKRKREDDGPSPMSCLATTDPRKRKREDIGPIQMPSLVTMDPRKRTRDDDTAPTRDPRKRRREDELRPAPSLVTRDPRKRLKG